MFLALVPWLMKAGIGARAAKFLSGGLIGLGLILAIGGALWFLRHDAYNDGRRDERAAWELKAEQAARAQAERERQADRNLEQQQARDDAAAQQRKQEIDDATRNLPDQAPSARQRARACIELRRHGHTPPACQPQPAARPAPAH